MPELVQNKSLVNLSLEMSRMASELIEMGGELTPEVEQLLDLTEGNLKDKIDAYKLFSDALNASSLYLKDLEVQFKTGRMSAENHIQRLKDNIKYSMSLLNQDALEGHAWLYKRSKIAPKLVIEDEAKIPAKYYKEEQVINRVLDREALKADLELGTAVPGCSIEENYMVRSYVNKTGQIKATKKEK